MPYGVAGALMENKNKFWIYLGLGVALALSFKWWVSPETNMPSKRWSIRANMEDEFQFHRSNNRNDKIAGLSNSRRSTEMVNVTSGTTAAAPAAAPAKAQQVAKAENTAKKKDAKKKKKKKKKSKVIGAPASETNTIETDDDSDDVAHAAPAGAPTQADSLQTPAGLAQAANTVPKTIAEWEKILLTTPNHRETTRFIALFQTKQVTPEVFYGVVGLMMNDGRTQMRELGVMALGATPSLQSYSMLVSASQREQGAVKTQAAGYLEDIYNRPQTINVIYTAVIGKDVSTDVKIQALKNLEVLVSKVRLPSSTTTTGETPKTSPSQALTQKRVIEYFKQLIKPIEELSKSGDPELQASASRLLPNLVAAAAQTLPSTGVIAENTVAP